MSRLYEAKIIDENRWEVIETDKDYYNSYKLKDKKKGFYYSFSGIIGFEQVTEDEFLVYNRVSYDDFEIARYKLQGNKRIKVFSKQFSNFYFISDDKLLFTYWGNSGPYRCSGVYSIEKNCLIEEANWLKGAVIEILFDKENQKIVNLYIEKEIFSYALQRPKILFTVDPNTLQPNSDCYSQFRDSFIKVTCKEDIDKIISDDEKSIKIIEEQIYQEKKEKLQKAKEKIIVRK